MTDNVKITNSEWISILENDSLVIMYEIDNIPKGQAKDQCEIW